MGEQDAAAMEDCALTLLTRANAAAANVNRLMFVDVYTDVVPVEAQKRKSRHLSHASRYKRSA